MEISTRYSATVSSGGGCEVGVGVGVGVHVRLVLGIGVGVAVDDGIGVREVAGVDMVVADGPHAPRRDKITPNRVTVITNFLPINLTLYFPPPGIHHYL